MITINPARELGLDDRLGSIEVGKDADIALFNGHPFDAFSRCELALIDGEVYFQRPEPDGKFAARPGDHARMPARRRRGRGTARSRSRPSPRGSTPSSGATLHPVSGPDDRQRHARRRRAARSPRSGRPGTPVPPEAQTIDAGGPRRLARPDRRGLDARPLRDRQPAARPRTSPTPAQFQPELRTSTALHPDSELIPVTRANGVLTAYVQPTGGADLGPGLRDRPRRLGAPRAGRRRSARRSNVNIPRYVAARPRQAASRPRPGAGGGEGGPDPQARRKEQLEAIQEQFRKALAYDEVRGRAPGQAGRAAAARPAARGPGPLCQGREAGHLPAPSIASRSSTPWRSPRS